MSRKKWHIIEPKDFEQTAKEYKINGKVYIRCTHVLDCISKPGLIAWFLRVGEKAAEKTRDNRATLGTRVHKLIERYLQGMKYTMANDCEEIKQDLELFYDFAKDCDLKPEALEQHLWSNKFGYAGTADYIGHYTPMAKYIVRGNSRFSEKSFVLLDWKTSSQLREEYWLQMAAYVFAFEELTGVKLDGAALVQIRYGKIRVKERTYDELKQLFPVYVAAIMISRWQFNQRDEVAKLFKRLKAL